MIKFKKFVSLLILLSIVSQALVLTPILSNADTNGRIISVDKSLSTDTEGVSYSTMKKALAYVNANPPASEEERITLEISPGTYREFITLNSPYITFKKKSGETGEVKLTYYYGANNVGYKSYDAYLDTQIAAIQASETLTDEEKSTQTAAIEAKKTLNSTGTATTGVGVGTQNSASITINGSARDFIAEDITFENSYNIEVTEQEASDCVMASGVSRSSQVQAVAIRVSADRSIFKNCKFYGRQDTLYIKDQSRNYFKDCYVEGTVDFIFGDAVAVFENCVLNTPYDSGYCTAANQATTCPYGYLFLNCTLTRTATTSKAAPSNNSYCLGRPWGAGASVTWVNCKMDSHIRTGPARFTDMSSNPAAKARWQEYNSMDIKGNYNLNSVKASYETILSATDVFIKYNPYIFLRAKYNKTTLTLDESDGWDPTGTAYLYSSQNYMSSLADTIDITSDVLMSNITLPSGIAGTDATISWKSSDESIITSDGTVTLGEYGKGVKDATLTATISLSGYQDEIRNFKVYVGSKSAESITDFNNEEIGAMPDYFNVATEEYRKGGTNACDGITWGVVDNIDGTTYSDKGKMFRVNQTATTILDPTVSLNKGIHDFRFDFGDQVDKVIEVSFDFYTNSITKGSNFEAYIKSSSDNGSKSITQIRSANSSADVYSISGWRDDVNSNTYVSSSANGKWYTLKTIIDSRGISTGKSPVIDMYLYDASGKLVGSTLKASPKTVFDSANPNYSIPNNLVFRPNRNYAVADFYVDNIYMKDITSAVNQDVTDINAGGTINIEPSQSLPRYGNRMSEITWATVEGDSSLVNPDGTINFDLCDNAAVKVQGTLTYGNSILYSATTDVITVNIKGLNVNIEDCLTVGGEKFSNVIANGLENATITYTSPIAVNYNGTLIFAVFKNGILENISTSDFTEGTTPTVSINEVTINSSNISQYSFKLLIWNGLDTIKPIRSVQELNFK